MAEPTQISAAALAEHNKASDVWMAISGKVYDCTDFVDEHPGGDEIMLAEAGKDATEPFDDVGHSEDARAMLEPMYVGEFEGGEAVSGSTPEVKTAGFKSQGSGTSILMFVPIGIFVAYYGYQYYLSQQSK